MKRSLVLLAILIMTACEGHEHGHPDGGDVQPDAGPPGCTCVALGADYMAGVGTLATIRLPELTVTTDRVPSAISGDPVVRVPGDGRIYVINRFGVDNITVIDAQSFALVDQFSTGAGSNPQDIAVSGNLGYVVALALPHVLVYDLTDTSQAPTTIDLSMFDPDGLPNPSSIAIQGGSAWVTLGLLDDAFQPTALGKLVAISLTNHNVTDYIDLQFRNPTGFLRGDEADLLVSTADDYSGTTGCLERIATEGQIMSSCDVMNSEVMGTVNAIAPSSAGTFFVVTSYDASFNPLGRIVHDAPTGLADLTPAGQVVTDVAHCATTDQLVYTDQATGGIRVWNVTGGEATTAPIDIGLPPGYSNGIVCW